MWVLPNKVILCWDIEFLTVYISWKRGARPCLTPRVGVCRRRSYICFKPTYLTFYLYLCFISYFVDFPFKTSNLQQGKLNRCLCLLNNFDTISAVKSQNGVFCCHYGVILVGFVWTDQAFVCCFLSADIGYVHVLNLTENKRNVNGLKCKTASWCIYKLTVVSIDAVYC